MDACVDQCVASGGNFLLMVLLARSLSEQDYGEFGLFLGAIFLTNDRLLVHLVSAVRPIVRRE
jgi:hypothetical protein